MPVHTSPTCQFTPRLHLDARAGCFGRRRRLRGRTGFVFVHASLHTRLHTSTSISHFTPPHAHLNSHQHSHQHSHQLSTPPTQVVSSAMSTAAMGLDALSRLRPAHTHLPIHAQFTPAFTLQTFLFIPHPIHTSFHTSGRLFGYVHCRHGSRRALPLRSAMVRRSPRGRHARRGGRT